MRYWHRKERLETSKEKISRKFSPNHPLSKKAVNSMAFFFFFFFFFFLHTHHTHNIIPKMTIYHKIELRFVVFGDSIKVVPKQWCFGSRGFIS